MRNSETPPTDRPASTGVVTFLDVLGWKGIYNREDDPISKLRKLVDSVTNYAKRYRGLTLAPTIHSISDTIVIYTTAVAPKEAARVIDMHGAICAHAIANSISTHIPVRGATAFGDFEARDNNYVGKAIDEAASWYEAGDWIGVHLTPSAIFAVDGSLRHWFDYYPPLKSGVKHSIPCVAWDAAWKSLNSSSDPKIELQSVFRDMGPITPEVAVKFFNTLTYFDRLLAITKAMPTDSTTASGLTDFQR